MPLCNNNFQDVYHSTNSAYFVKKVNAKKIIFDKFTGIAGVCCKPCLQPITSFSLYSLNLYLCNEHHNMIPFGRKYFFMLSETNLHN